MIWKSRGYVVGAAVTLALVIAGCGGSDSGTTPETAPRLTKAEILKKGNAICARDSRTINVAFSRFGKRFADAGKVASDKALNEETAKVVLPLRNKEVQRLRAMGPPREDRQQFEKLLGAMEEGIAQGERDHGSLLASNEDYAFAKAFDLGLSFGLKKCWLG